jgi:pyruvate,water dikinase
MTAENTQIQNPTPDPTDPLHAAAPGATASVSDPRPAAGASPLVLPFEALDRRQLAVAGGKAANLGELVQGGFPVPAGFCVTTHAYARVADGQRLAAVLARLASVGSGDAAVLNELAAEARQALLEAPVPTVVTTACADAYRQLGDGARVAVRSSATAEDLPDASFAGQQDTYLNMVGEAAVVQAIRRCWASLFTDRAVAYRTTHGIDHRAVQLAVAVQRMVPARVAGVMFTADPVSGRRRTAVIDASPGLGEAVVSGAVNPDHFEVSCTTGEILLRRPGDKTVAIVDLPDGGTERRQLAATREPCLTDVELAQLTALASRVESFYGAPQDTEWAIDRQGALWLLQSRPITTLYPLPANAPATDDQLRVYVNFNVAQGVLQPLTPMGRQAWRMFTAQVARAAGFDLDPLKGPAFIVDAAGRLMLDVTVPLRNPLGRRGIAFALSRMEARSAALIAQVLADPRLSVQPAGPGRLALRALRALVGTRIPFTLLRALARPAEARARCAAVLAHALARGEVPAEASPTERLATVEGLLTEGVSEVFLTGVPTMVAGMVALQLARQVLGDLATPAELETTLRALPHNPTTEMDLELWSLSRQLGADPASRALLAGTAPSELSARYRAGALPPLLQEALRDFLGRWGARGIAEIDLGVPRWGEDPAHVLGSLANCLAVPSGQAGAAADAQFAHGAAEAAAMVEMLVGRAGVRGPLVRFLFDRMRQLAGVREAPKFHAVQLLTRARQHLQAVGAHLAAAGRLAQADDIFMLDLGDLRAALDGRGGPDLRALANARRAEHTRELTRRKLPRVLLSDGTEPSVPLPSAGQGLRGSPASGGVVEARARVVMDPHGARLEPGEILVTPSTDPGWTPLFLTAGGLVMEMGGAMSHGAVVAREYGIPAVVGVAGATEWISTGDVLRVDGATGTIERLK